MDIPKLFRRKAEVRAGLRRSGCCSDHVSVQARRATVAHWQRLRQVRLASGELDFHRATVKPDNVALRSVSPVILDAIGRQELVSRSGESLACNRAFAMGG